MKTKYSYNACRDVLCVFYNLKSYKFTTSNGSLYNLAVRDCHIIYSFITLTDLRKVNFTVDNFIFLLISSINVR